MEKESSHRTRNISRAIFSALHYIILPIAAFELRGIKPRTLSNGAFVVIFCRGTFHCQENRSAPRGRGPRELQAHTIKKAMSLTTDLSSHLALVTGATGGIGKATCLALARLNCSVAVHYNSAASTATSLVAELKALGVRAAPFQADLSSYEETRKLHAAVVAELGHPSILFNNAGLTMGKSGIKKVEEISIDDFEQTWRANCGTAFLLTQLCLPKMVEVGWGRVIFCSSVAGFTGGVVGPHYA